MRASSVYAVILVSAGLAVYACATPPPPPKEPAHTETVSDAGADVDAEPPPPKSLYERLGKQEGITAVVDVLVKNLQADPKFKARVATLKGPKLDKFKKDLADQICFESGGPDAGADCKYEGRFMKELLGAKNKLKEDEWNAMLLELRNSFEENKVTETEQQDLTAVISKFREDVVQAAPQKK